MTSETTIEPMTLHAALDSYAEQIGQQRGRRNASTQQRLHALRRLKDRHEDMPLCNITSDVCVELISVWRSRPVSKKSGQPLAR